MFAILIKISGIALPVFVFLTMLNVGLTQKPSDILVCLRNKKFGIRMLIANFILAPALMWGMLQLFPIDPYLGVGLTIFGISAGAPFLIKLTQLSEHDLELGASTMITLILGTIILVPLLLPLVLPEIEIDGFMLAWTLVKQLIFPMVLGWLLVKFLPKIMEFAQPWVAKIGNWALYLMLFATLVGYFPELKEIMGQGALLIALAYILGAFGIGYLMGGHDNEDHLEDIGALGTAQRNTAASMIIAAQNFSGHPEVLVLITVANALGIAMLIGIAKYLSKDNKVEIVFPKRKLVHPNS
ncbi:bile acid:sodium symporter family protein [Rufibacter glacialis]|uniref:Bile acid:sodium symporter family protein n=1 Tax=Rufibacter glacialis TaxID=1259555 RepID=A0A5M8QVM1_9BACT|nr:bile acid:sodium symporter [Rufibacter glacialis]KAA6438172.1 sodium:proton symporter [Rufibacter glacialis]GGK89226.1 transporter [Rufibacter glacialis]